MSTELKSKVFESCTIPAVMYGVQTWTPTYKQLSAVSISPIVMGGRERERERERGRERERERERDRNKDRERQRKKHD